MTSWNKLKKLEKNKMYKVHGQSYAYDERRIFQKIHQYFRIFIDLLEPYGTFKLLSKKLF